MSANQLSLTIVLSLVLVGSALAKLKRREAVVGSLRRADVPDSWLPRLALLECAGAVGLLSGLAYPPLGIAAGVGVFLFFCGAVVFHLRAHDRKGLIAPASLTLLTLLVTLSTVQNL
ncbi:DoxX family protein [Streptomyces sp. NPDC090083]|uniref:DoxX family protein n=1 Tax=Streptomyces sp. NPDC090083 TaxID=3365941 RepID=UPI00380B7FD7